MRIPLKIIDGRLYLNALIRSPKLRIGFGQVDFIVDTGANETLLSEGYILKLNIPVNSLSFYKYIYLGGSKSKLFKLNNVNLYFKTNENKTEIINLPFITVALGTRKNVESKKISQVTPCILGTDFLEKYKLRLVFSPSKDIAYLEKET